MATAQPTPSASVAASAPLSALGTHDHSVAGSTRCRLCAKSPGDQDYVYGRCMGNPQPAGAQATQVYQPISALSPLPSELSRHTGLVGAQLVARVRLGPRAAPKGVLARQLFMAVPFVDVEDDVDVAARAEGMRYLKLTCSAPMSMLTALAEFLPKMKGVSLTSHEIFPCEVFDEPPRAVVHAGSSEQTTQAPEIDGTPETATQATVTPEAAYTISNSEFFERERTGDFYDLSRRGPTTSTLRDHIPRGDVGSAMRTILRSHFEDDKRARLFVRCPTGVPLGRFSQLNVSTKITLKHLRLLVLGVAYPQFEPERIPPTVVVRELLGTDHDGRVQFFELPSPASFASGDGTAGPNGAAAPAAGSAAEEDLAAAGVANQGKYSVHIQPRSDSQAQSRVQPR